MATASHSRVRVAPNLYQRGDGVFVAGLSIDGKWTMKTLDARTKTEAKLQLARLRTDPSKRRATVAAEREQVRWNALAIAACSTVAVGVAFARDQSTHYQLRRGDLVSVPSVGWTCLVSTHRDHPIVTCTTNDKPIRSITVAPQQIVVGNTRPPTVVHGGYSFRY